MKLKALIHFLETIAPLSYQESYDNAGLLVGNPEMEISGVLVCLDSIESVLEEAIEKGCNVIIAHHPIIFQGLKKLNGFSYIERVVIKAIKHNLALYAIHTNLDNVYQNGVNTRIAARLRLEKTSLLAPKDTDGLVGSGMIGMLPSPMGPVEFLKYLKEQMQADCIRHTALLNRDINKVAVCGGSGSFLLSKALQQNADIFITADYKYHQFFDADGKIIIADIGHFESEQFTIDLLSELILENFSNFAVHRTTMKTNPVFYYS